MEHLKGGIFISPKDIQIIHGWQNIRQGQREIRAVKDALGLSKPLTVVQYCEYMGLDLDYVISYLNVYRT